MDTLLSSQTYDQRECYYFVVKALGLADDEEKKCNKRKDDVHNPNVEKGNCQFYIETYEEK